MEAAGYTDPTACNFDNGATDDDGSCEFDLSGSGCAGDLDGSGMIQLNDLLEFLLVYGTMCE